MNTTITTICLFGSLWHSAKGDRNSEVPVQCGAVVRRRFPRSDRSD